MTLADLYDQHAKECKRELADVNGTAATISSASPAPGYMYHRRTTFL